MKRGIIVFILAIAVSQLSAQNSSMEAKAAYLLAEEAFASNDWKGTLSYLEECRKKIGKPNSKILYLKILTELELAKSDSSYYKVVIKTINDFENAYDVKDFNEEKSLEVMKAKVRINRMIEAADREKSSRAERAARMKTLGGIIVSEQDGHGFVMALADIGKMNLADARKACEDLELNGHSDWRLPTLQELQMMIELNTTLSAANPSPIGFTAMSGKYWINYSYGNTAAEKKLVKEMYAVRPVRSF